MSQLLDFLGSSTFYLIPFVVGSLFTGPFRHQSRALTFSLGAILIYGLFFVANLISSPGIFLSLMRGVLFLAFAAWLVKALYSFSKQKIYFLETIRTKVRELMPFALLFVITGFLHFFIWKSLTPYPLALNWDIYEHITNAHLIAGGQFAFSPSQISDTFTFDGYSTLFHTLLSLPELLLKSHLIGLYWWLEYWHYLLSSIVVYVATVNFLGNKKVAFLSALISSLVFESSIVYSIQHFSLSLKLLPLW
ncbi:MAG: hypothetical protein Q7S60_05625 [bacterium]|nr:hypothetical protein [bacterium]